MREEIEEMKKEVEELREIEKSVAMELLDTQKKQSSKIILLLSIIIVVISTFWFITGAYLVYTISDIETIKTEETYEQEITDFESINNSTITNGGN